MSKQAKKAETIFHEVTPIERRRLDPYNGVFVQLGETYVLDAKKAEFLAGLGEVEIVNENVPFPGSVKEEAEPKVKAEAKTETKEK